MTDLLSLGLSFLLLVIYNSCSLSTVRGLYVKMEPFVTSPTDVKFNVVAPVGGPSCHHSVALMDLRWAGDNQATPL